MQSFLDQQQLPSSFVAYAERWFNPLIDDICQQCERRSDHSTPLFLGISGCQGSGKSTLADYCEYRLKEEFKLNVANCSIDDFYLRKREREALASQVHPLLKTRGVPGTHDVAYAVDCFNALSQSNFDQTESNTVELPIFDKLTDDRSSHTKRASTPVDIVIFEGWCLGCTAQSAEALVNPVNELERLQDPAGEWREYVNTQLTQHYPRLFDRIDCWVMLKAPSFDCVLNWRTEQEEKLAKQQKDKPNPDKKVMGKQEIYSFIQYYQRLTEHILATLPEKMDYIFELDKSRQIQAVKHR